MTKVEGNMRGIKWLKLRGALIIFSKAILKFFSSVMPKGVSKKIMRIKSQHYACLVNYNLGCLMFLLT